MGLTKRKDSYYVEFPVMESPDGKTLQLARGVPGARLKRWKVGCTNKQIAKEMEAKIRTDLLMDKVKSEQGKPLLFSEWAAAYLELDQIKRLRSYVGRSHSIKKHLIPFLGRKLITEIKPEHIEQFRAQRKRADGSPASVQTINHDHIALKHCLNIAIRRGLLSANPASRVSMPDPGNERDRVLSAEEWDGLYRAAKPHLRPVLLLAYQLGQRFGEITGLTWDRVDLKRGFITLRGIDTKTRNPRQVPMTPDVRRVLHALSKVRSLVTRHVFLYKGKPLTRVSRSFKTALKDAGITDFRFHDLRHCASTNLRRAGVDTATAMKVVGHKSEKMWKRYNAIEEKDLTQAAQKLNTYLKVNTVITPAQTGCQDGAPNSLKKQTRP